MKKRNKKYNPVKHVQLNNERILKGFAVAYIANETPNNPIMLIDLKGNERPVTKTMSDALTKLRYKWSIYLCVFGLNGDEKYTKSKIVICPEPYLQSELVVFLNNEHQKLMKEFNQAHIYGAGWLASAVGRDFTEGESFEIFNKLGAWK